MKLSSKALKIISLGGLLSFAFFSMGCQPTNNDSNNNHSTSGRIVSTMNCFGEVTGLSGPAWVLNGLQVEYQAVLTDAGDVYATAAIIDELQQVSGTRYYAAPESGSGRAEVNITADFVGAANGGLWRIAVDRVSRVTRVIYEDVDLASRVDLDFAPQACTVTGW